MKHPSCFPIKRAILLTIIAALLCGFAPVTYAKGGGHSGHGGKSRGHAVHSTRTQKVQSVRPFYGGGKRTVSHGGRYVGGHGPFHKRSEERRVGKQSRVARSD